MMTPVFVASGTLYLISFILQTLSIVIVGCVLVTKERKYKNVAHVSWCTAATTLFMGMIFTFFFTLASILIRDSCIVLDHTENTKTTADLALVYPQEITPLLDACLFSRTKNAADNLGFGSTAQALDQLRYYANVYNVSSHSEFLQTKFELID